MSSILAGLNPEQLEAVTLPHQSALILAGAGSGKTRVLTTRIAYLIQSGQASPHGVLAVTFTNKAAKEMIARISAMLPINTRGMWIGTFHGLCNRMLRLHHRDAGLPQLFQILDVQDQLSLVKRVMKAMGVDDEKFPPRQVQWFINGNKEAGLRASKVEAYDDFSRRMTEVYAAYDEQCNREGVVDFAELLLRCFELLTANEVLRDHYRERFAHILVDEFQDTNRLQYLWLRLLAGNRSAVFAVGDDDQCLVRGTLVTMADGSRKPIERVLRGDRVLSCFGNRDFRSAEVVGVFKRRRKVEPVTIRTRRGRTVTSTPEHTHFAGYLLGETPQSYFTYLMHKRGVGYRLGTSQVYTRGQRKPMVGFKQRALQEHADALWIVGVHDSENEARLQEILLSLRYGLPTLPFVPRKGKAVNGLVHDPNHISRLYKEVDTSAAASRLMADFDIDPDQPHHVPRSRNSNRRNISITLCGDNRGSSVLHRICVMGNDPQGKQVLEALGLSVRPAKKRSQSWRFETSNKDMGKLLALAQRIERELGGRIILKAGFHSTPLPFVRARGVRPGMVMVGANGGLDIVEQIERHRMREATVFDLDVAGAHNFIANGLVTHNSIYAFRGAHSANMQSFERDFGVAKVIKLEQNYRSHGNILDAANHLIRNNRTRLGKNLWTAESHGEPLRVFQAPTDLGEATYVVDEVKALSRDGVALSEIAVLYRSNAQSRVLEHALFNAGLPYRVYGGLRFFERQEIKHALAYLRLTANPDDDNALLRVINFPTRGIGARSLEQLQESAKAVGGSLWQAAIERVGRAVPADAQPAATGRPTSAPLKGIPAFVALIESLRSATQGLPLPEIVEHVVEHSGLKQHYQSEREGADRLENLNELVNAAVGFVHEAEDDSLSAFLAHAALEAGEHQAGEGMEALQLMTVHSAKGLEFHSVFISGLEEGLFPHEQSFNDDGGLDEERRLMYVALTRSKRRLYLTFAQSRMLHGQTRYNVSSRFLEEIPERLMKWVNLTAPFTPVLAPEPRPKAAVSFIQPRAAHGWQVGQSVTHPKFGSGVIVNCEGHGPDARVQVRFSRAGVKWLALEYAKLSPA